MQKKVGHIARACRRKPTQTGFKDKRLKNHHYMEDEVQDTAASQKQSKEHPYPLFNMDSNVHKAFMVDVKVETELGRLESTGIISPVQFCDWAAPIVPVMKSNGTIRICGDFKVTINSVSQVDTYPLPRVEE